MLTFVRKVLISFSEMLSLNHWKLKLKVSQEKEHGVNICAQEVSILKIIFNSQLFFFRFFIRWKIYKIYKQNFTLFLDKNLEETWLVDIPPVTVNGSDRYFAHVAGDLMAPTLEVKEKILIDLKSRKCFKIFEFHKPNTENY